MLFGHLAVFEELVDPILAALIKLLAAEGAYYTAWAMSSLVIYARLYPYYQARILGKISKYQQGEKPSVRNRAKKALKILLEDKLIPENWVKNAAVQAKLRL